MYYNIKIKSQNSEFILESNDKIVTQREMDMYFAYIFGVSDDFISKIKKIEIKSENLKSIDEFEKKAEIGEKSSVMNLEEVGEGQANLSLNDNISVFNDNKTEVVYQASLDELTLSQQTENQSADEDCSISSQDDDIEAVQIEESNVSDNKSESIEENYDNVVNDNKTEVVYQASLDELTHPEQVENESVDEAEIKSEILDKNLVGNIEEVSSIKDSCGDDILNSDNKISNNENKNVKEQNDTANHLGNIDDILKLIESEMDSVNLFNEDDNRKESNKELEIFGDDSNGIQYETKKDLKIEEIKIKNSNDKINYYQNNQSMVDNIFSSYENNLNIENSKKSEITITALNEALEENVLTNENEDIEVISDIQAFDDTKKIADDSHLSTKSELVEGDGFFDSEEISLNDNNINFSDKNEIVSKELTEKLEVAEQKEDEVQSGAKIEGPVIDFHLFLSGFNVNELKDEFLICAYYIKNMLHEDNF